MRMSYPRFRASRRLPTPIRTMPQKILPALRRILLLLSIFMRFALKILNDLGCTDHDQNYGPHLAEAKDGGIQIVQKKENSDNDEQQRSQHVMPPSRYASSASTRPARQAEPARTSRLLRLQKR